MFKTYLIAAVGVIAASATAYSVQTPNSSSPDELLCSTVADCSAPDTCLKGVCAGSGQDYPVSVAVANVDSNSWDGLTPSCVSANDCENGFACIKGVCAGH